MAAFHAMTKERQREIASRGGKAAHAKGTAHEFKKGSELAREAGRKGGAVHRARMQARRVAQEAALSASVAELQVPDASVG
jgi:uncharacterized protein